MAHIDNLQIHPRLAVIALLLERADHPEFIEEAKELLDIEPMDTDHFSILTVAEKIENLLDEHECDECSALWEIDKDVADKKYDVVGSITEHIALLYWFKDLVRGRYHVDLDPCFPKEIFNNHASSLVFLKDMLSDSIEYGEEFIIVFEMDYELYTLGRGVQGNAITAYCKESIKTI